MKATVLLAAVGALALSSAALGNEVKSYSVNGGALNDATGSPVIPGVTNFTINVTEHGEIKAVQEVLLSGLVHSWAGDLLITITHGATSVTLVDRPGFPTGPFGESENYNGNYSFQDGFAPIPDEFPGAGDSNLASGIYGPDPAAGNALANFVGQDKFGLWTLTITDNAGGDTGSLGGFTLVIHNVPAPGAMALLGLAGLTARRRRRSA